MDKQGWITLAIERGDELDILRSRFADLRRAALDILDEYAAVAGRYIDVTELTFMPSKEDRRTILAAKVAKFRERILCDEPKKS